MLSMLDNISKRSLNQQADFPFSRAPNLKKIAPTPAPAFMANQRARKLYIAITIMLIARRTRVTCEQLKQVRGLRGLSKILNNLIRS